MFRAVTLDEYFRDVYAPRKLLGKSRSCRMKYERHLRWLKEFLGRPPLLSDLTDETIATLMQQRMNLGRSPGTVNSLHDQLMALGKFAAMRGHLDQAPDVVRLTEYKRVPTAWSKEQLRALFQSCELERGFIGDVLACNWWLTLHSVLWDCGARIGVVLKVTPDDIEQHTRRLTLRAEAQKQKADQAFTLHPDTMIALESIGYRHRSVVFPWEKNGSMIWHDYKRILRRAGLPSGRRDMFHKMRRSVASWFEAAGGDATKLLGHSSRKITLSYLDPTIVGQAQASNLLFRPRSLKNS